MRKLVLLIILAAFIIGCGGGQRASIDADIVAYHSNNILYREADVTGYMYNGFKTIPLVYVNEETLWISQFNYSPFMFNYVGDVPWVNLGSECKLEVDYGDGRGEATDTLPTEFLITSPTGGDTLHKGEDLIVNWQTSTGADWYWLYIDISYDYIDTSGGFNYFNFDLDTMVTGTAYTLTSSRIFPGDVDTIFWNSNYVDMEAISGPQLLPGAEGNIKGDAVGFFWCRYDAQRVWFNIGPLACESREHNETEIREKHRKILQKFAEENQ